MTAPDSTRRQSRFRLSTTKLVEMAKVARDYGVTVRMEVDGAVTVSPIAASAIDDPESDGLESWDDPPRRTSRSLTPTTGATLADEFAKMNPKSRKILSGGYLWDEEDFRQHIVKQPINKREITVLKALSSFGVGSPADFRQVKVGVETQERLVARGYIETRPQEKFPDRTGYYLLTEPGLKAWENAQLHPSHAPIETKRENGQDK